MKLDVVYAGMFLCAVVVGLPVALECWAGRTGATVTPAPVVAPGTTAPVAAHCEMSFMPYPFALPATVFRQPADANTLPPAGASLRRPLR